MNGHGYQGKRVVVPIDLSDASITALNEAIRLVGRQEMIDVVHVIPHLTSAEPGVIWKTVDDAKRIAHAQEAIGKRLTEEGFADVPVTIRVGRTGQEISKFASQKGAGLIVISSHGHTGFERFVLGSVAEQVVRLAQCSVLVLKSRGNSAT